MTDEERDDQTGQGPADEPEAEACDTPTGRTEVQSNRYCLTCKKNTPFTFTYAEGYLIRAECRACGTVERDRKLLAKVFAEDLIDRAFEAMKRQTKRTVHDPIHSVGGLPKKMVQKSVRELQRMLNIFKE